MELALKESIGEVHQYISSKSYRFDALINNAAVRYDLGKEIPSV